MNEEKLVELKPYVDYRQGDDLSAARGITKGVALGAIAWAIIIGTIIWII